MANRWLSVVGSRRPSLAARDFVAQVVLTASAIGLGIASGGAPGVDQAAASGAVGPVVECLPCGLDREVGFGVSGTTRLSGCPPSAGFMVSAAKERNAWLYALGAVTVVVQPRLGQGGTWTGCADALRRRLGTVAVWAPPVGAVDSETHAAIDALVRLGAVPIDGGPCLTDQLASLAVAPRAPRQPSLFGDLIREAG
jgi:predicted Rossmann fold nucleotide-binding protein DprA/Smf involved in DNA uptake